MASVIRGDDNFDSGVTGLERLGHLVREGSAWAASAPNVLILYHTLSGTWRCMP